MDAFLAPIESLTVEFDNLLFPASGPVTISFNGLHHKGNFLAIWERLFAEGDFGGD